MQIPHHLYKEHGIGEPQARGRRTKVDDIGEPVVTPTEVIAPRHAVLEVDEVDEPSPRKPKLLDRWRSRRGRGRSGSHPAPAPGERAPKRPKGRRVPLDSDISDIWAFAGRRLENTPHYATGRMLQYQAPAAGGILDRAIAGTLPDRLLFQPIAKNRDKYEDAAFLLAGPFLTFSITTTMQRMQTAIEAGDKEQYDNLSAKLEVQREAFDWMAEQMLPRLAAGVKVAREKKAKEKAAISEAFPDLGDDDPIAAFGDMCFAPPGWVDQPQEDNGVTFNGKSGEGSVPPRREGAVPFGG